MVNYAGSLNINNTPVTEAVPGKNMVQNNDGGFVFALDNWKRLDRFLILGAEGGNYYVGEQELVKDNAKAVLAAIQEDGVRVVNRTVEISKAGRAPKNDPAIFVLALAATYGDAKTKAAAYNAITSVCRIGTHLFQFVNQLKGLERGWSRGLRTGVSKFYTNRNPDSLAMQLIKYRSRHDFNHRDVLRLTHPSTKSQQHVDLFRYVVARDAGKAYEIPTNSIIAAFEELQKTTKASRAIELIKAANLPWEAVPTELLNDKTIWEALLPSMGLTAMMRNLGKMSKLGLFEGTMLNKNTQFVVQSFQDQAKITESRIHPIAILIGLKTYEAGKGFKGSLTWTPAPQIVSALNKAFYLAFSNVEATGKNFYIGVDVSPSMFGAEINNTNLTAAEAAAALSLVVARTESKYHIAGFSSNMRPLRITPDMRLDEVMRVTNEGRSWWGGTNCAAPVEDALANNMMVDVFVIITDNDVNTGRHPFQVLQEYRRKVNRNAKMVVLGTTSTGFTIADQNDAGMLDIVGFDSNIPTILADFVRG